MDTNSQVNNLNIDDIYRQAFLYSSLNILSILLASNIGITYELDETISVGLENIKPLLAIYDSGKLNINFIENSDESKDDIELSFNPNEFNTKITPKYQALMIISEIKLREKILGLNASDSNDNNILEVILLDSAINQAKFCTQHLLNSDGFFYGGDYIKSDNEAYEITLDPSSFQWVDQSYMLLALVKLNEAINNTCEHSFEFLQIKDNIVSSIESLLQLLIDAKEKLMDLPTMDLSIILNNIIETINLFEENNSFYNYIASLGEELKSREFNNGYIKDNRDNHAYSSLSTHFKAIEAFSNSYIYTKYYCFKDTAELLYDKLNMAWDNNLNLFIIHRKNKIKYTSKTIAYIIKSLNKFSNILDNEEKINILDKQMKSFFNATLNTTGLQVLPNIDNLDIDMFLGDKIENALNELFNKGNTYIVLRGFEIDQRKDKTKIYGYKFLAEYALTLVEAILSLDSN